MRDIPPANPPTEVVPILAPEILPAVTREQLIHEQQNDVDLSAFAAKAVSETEASKVGVCYYVLSGLLMLFLGCQAAFEKVKAMLSHSPVLAAPDFSKPIFLSLSTAVTLVQGLY